MKAGVAPFVLALLVAAPVARGQSAPPPAPAAPSEAPPRPLSSARLADAASVRKRLGLTPEYERVSGVEAMKIAVLDYGFDGMDGAHRYLPEGAVVVEHYDPEFVRRNDLGDPQFRKPFEPLNRHGRVMAQLIWAVTGSSPRGPKFFLLNANGPTMLRRAVRYAIEQKVDVLLFSGSFEGGGNGDGRGPIDRIVDEAVAARILWINSAGNNRKRVYTGPVRMLSEGYLRLRDGADVASLRFRNRVDENTVTVTLTWNDYRDEEDAGTDKDLDLYVEDWAGRRIGASEKHQVVRGANVGPEESLNPRERVILPDLAATPDVPSDPEYAYRIRVRARRGRFTAADRVRILVTASREAYLAPGLTVPMEAVEFLDANDRGEIYPPADHPQVLTVGDTGPDSSIGPTADGRIKPDLLLDDSRAYLTDGQVTSGSSNAAAYFAGVAAVLKAAEPGLTAGHLRALARQGSLPEQASSSGPARGAVTGRKVTQDLRVWKTPSRSRLAQIVRARPGA